MIFWGDLVRVADEIEPRIPEIRRWAEDFFVSTELRQYGLYLDANGEAALDPASPMNQSQMGGGGMQSWTQEEREILYAKVREQVTRFHQELPILLAAFTAYNDLDSLDLTVLTGTLGGQVAQAGGAPTNIHARIGYAESYWVAPVDGLITAEDWWGDAATNFKTELLHPFHDAAELQRGYVTELARVAQSYHDHMAKMSEALVAVADECISALGGPGRVTAGEITEMVTGLSITSIVAGVIGFFPPAAIAAGAMSVGAGIVSFVAPLAMDPAPGPPLHELHGDTVWAVFSATREVLATMDMFRADTDDKLSKALDAAMNSTSSLAHPGLAVDPPSLADDPARASFNHLTVGSEPGVPLNKDKVVVSIVKVYQAGQVNLAGAAAQYAQAKAELASCTPPGSVTRFFPRSTAKYEEARRLFDGILDRTRQALEASAQALMTIAKNYQTTDDRIGEAFNQIGRLETPPPNPEPERLGGI
jgi:hypothetical protein